MSRQPALPSVRAVSLFARTIFRELKRAAYSRAEILGFVNEVIDLLTADPTGGPLSGVSDPETQVANTDVLLGALDFEMRRAQEMASTVLVICVELSVPDVTPDDIARELHLRFTRQLRRGVRPSDTVARMHGHCVAVLPGASSDAVELIARRMAQPLLAPRRSDDKVPEGTVIRYRYGCYDAATPSASASGALDRDGAIAESAEILLARVLAAAPAELVPDRGFAEASETRWLRRTAPPPSQPGEVVLALGGGAARAAAHVGVLRALRAEGIRVSAISGASGGAIVGAMALAGMDEPTMLERFLSFPKTQTYMRMRRQYAAYRRSAANPRANLEYFRQSGLAFLSSTRIAAFDDELFATFIEHFVGPDRDIGKLSGSFAATATDLVGGRTVTLSSGPLHAALRGSCALPGLFAPQRFENRLLVDGATISEVPVKAALAFGRSAPVLAVYLARPEHIVTQFDSSVEVMARSNALVHRELVREQLRHALLLVTVALEETGWLDFRSAVATEEAGFRTMVAHLATLRSRATDRMLEP